MWDAVIIGAGVSGCSVARELARYDLKVLVVEKGHDLCAGGEGKFGYGPCRL